LQPDRPGVAAIAVAPPWRSVEFISDLHLCADLPRTAQALLAHLRHSDADAVVLLGDLFEAWVGDDMALPLDVAQAADAGTGDAADFERAFSAELAAIAARRWIGCMVGNRDFLLGPAWLAACHLHALPDPTHIEVAGQALVLSHGDALCLADHDYQQFRAQVRDPAWQQAFLARPLAERLALARQMRQASQAHQTAQSTTAEGSFADVDPGAAVALLHKHDAFTLVHGHTHRPARHVMAEAAGQIWQRLVTSDWDLDHATPARAEVLRLDATGWHRLPPVNTPAPTSAT
jgi:UDP-2,3-diacylglucosamine hydrolase